MTVYLRVLTIWDSILLFSSLFFVHNAHIRFKMLQGNN
jgi:hypothetical protein